MGCTRICEKEVMFFGEDGRDTSHSVYLFLTVLIHELIGLKKSAILPDRKRPEGEEWDNVDWWQKLGKEKGFSFYVHDPNRSKVLLTCQVCKCLMRRNQIITVING